MTGSAATAGEGSGGRSGGRRADHPADHPADGPADHPTVARGLGLYLAANLGSTVGTWVHNLAQGVLVFQQTGSNTLVGAANSAQFAGVALLLPWSGMLADRYERRAVVGWFALLCSGCGAAFTVLSATGRASAASMIALAGLLGLTAAAVQPAAAALVPLLCRPSRVAQAVTANSLTYTLGRAIGPGLGAALLAGPGQSWAFALNAASFALLAAVMLVVQPRPQDRAEPRGPAAPRLAEVVADRRIGWMLAAVAALSLAIDPVSTLAPTYAVGVLGSGAGGAGRLMTCFGAGAAVSGAVLLARRRPTLVQLAAAAGVLIAGMLGLAAAPSEPVAAVALVVAGAGFVGSSTTAVGIIQLAVDDRLRGRAMAAWSAAYLGVRPVTALLDGAAADVAGPRIATVGSVLPLVLVVGLAWVSLGRGRASSQPGPRGRRAEREEMTA
ncbi:MAG TPA: MFS transporter [Acidimicrobiales bacterium]